MATTRKMLTAVFRDQAAAVRSFEWLQRRGYDSSEISVLMSDRTRATFRDGTQVGEEIAARSKAAEGMAAGGVVGTAVGATLAAIAVVAPSIALPGLGLVLAGPIVAALAGGGAGAVAGGAIGGLVGLGIPESNAKAYEAALRGGGVAFGVVPHADEDADVLQAYLEEHGAENIVFM